MTRALIGDTGFVGGTLVRQAPFDCTYNSRNIDSIRKRRHDLVVCAGAPGSKWKANQDPLTDRASIDLLMSALNETTTSEVILISTVDVYPRPIGVYEDTPIDETQSSPYGYHRRILEKFVAGRFRALIVRLPGLFGQGLKKNVIFDFLHTNRLDNISAESVFQFYDMARLWADIERCRKSNFTLVNFATEPVSVRTMAHEAFNIDFSSAACSVPAAYDMRTRFAERLGGSAPYLYAWPEIRDGLRHFIGSYAP
jgi:nucleoside-diphosphate-sugar epimerase